MSSPTPTRSSPSSEPRQRSALERFAGFFRELEGVFIEREDILAQLALALLGREHALITGPPGTGKSRLAASVVGRVVDAETGAPSLFAKQFTESTVQTELIGPVDFRTLTETGRTEHFTDEGMLGAVHAFLDEVLDGRDMLLRSTLNILEERELKQGTRITPGLIECAVMTSNRYLTEVLEESRQTLLAFVDRIAFVSFIPRGFASAGSLERIVSTTLGDGIVLDARLTVDDVDVLQAMVEEVRVPHGVVTDLVTLARAFEERAGQLERSDPTFTATRYFSTRAVARLARLLQAVVVFDKATARPDRALVAERVDLGALRLAMMLAGPRPEHLEALLTHETDPRERRQLHIMQCELDLFRECLDELPARDDEVTEAPAEVSASETTPAAQPPTSLEHRLSEAVAALSGSPGDLGVTERVLEVSRALETERPTAADAARAARGHALTALTEALRLSAPHEVAPSIGSLGSQLDAFERADALRQRLLGAEVIGVDRVAENATYAEARAALVEHCVTVFDRVAHDAVEPAVQGGGALGLGPLLDALEPTLSVLRAIDARVAALGAEGDPPSKAVIARRVAPAMRAAYATIDAPDRDKVSALVTETLDKLEGLGLAGAVRVSDHLSWVADALARGEPDAPTEAPEPTYEGYRALRAAEVRTPLAFALAQLIGTLRERSGGAFEPSLEAAAATLQALPSSLRERLATLDLDRIERAAALLAGWRESAGAEVDPALLKVAFEERALLRFALECRLVGALFGEHRARAEGLADTIRGLSDAIRASARAAQRHATEARWAELTGS